MILRGNAQTFGDVGGIDDGIDLDILLLGSPDSLIDDVPAGVLTLFIEHELTGGHIVGGIERAALGIMHIHENGIDPVFRRIGHDLVQALGHCTGVIGGLDDQILPGGMDEQAPDLTVHCDGGFRGRAGFARAGHTAGEGCKDDHCRSQCRGQAKPMGLHNGTSCILAVRTKYTGLVRYYCILYSIISFHRLFFQWRNGFLSKFRSLP